MERRLARRGAATVGDWMARRKMSTGSIHGPRCTCLTRSDALNQSEEGGRRRGRAHRRGRRRRSSTAVKVPVLRVGEQLWGLVKLWDHRTVREVGEVVWHRQSGGKQRRARR
jgi:hypothetical protein